MRKDKSRKRIHTLSFKEQVKKSKGLFALYVFLRLIVVLVMIAQIFNRDYENVFLCILTLVLFTVPSFLEKNWHIDLPDTLEVIVLVFIFAAEILGEISSYYLKYPGWDTALHTTTGFLAAAIGFSLVDILNENENVKLDLSPFFLAVVAFCFSMTIAVLWEFFEFSMDFFWGKDMQKDYIIHTINSTLLDPAKSNKVVSITNIESVVINGQDLGLGGYLDIGIIDTMKDMFVNFIGAVCFSIIGYFYVKNRGKGKFASNFIPTIDKEAQLEDIKQYREAREAKKSKKKRNKR